MLFGIFLPSPRPSVFAADTADETQRDYGLLAGQLASLLARCSEAGRRRQFPKAREVHRRIRLAQAAGLRVHVPATLLSDAVHEVAQYVDAETRAAMRRCMVRQLPATAPARPALAAA